MGTKNETEDTVRLNEHEMPKSDFERKKEELEKKPGVSVVETGEGEFRTRIKG